MSIKGPQTATPVGPRMPKRKLARSDGLFDRNSTTTGVCQSVTEVVSWLGSVPPPPPLEADGLCLGTFYVHPRAVAPPPPLARCRYFDLGPVLPLTPPTASVCRPVVKRVADLLECRLVSVRQ